MNDHARTRREIYRRSPTDAEAYDEYAKAMVDMARFVKPILSMVPPDPMSLRPARASGGCSTSASASASSRGRTSTAWSRS